jgi:hypothetical protein
VPAADRRIQRQSTPDVHAVGAAEAQGVPRLKWSDESERIYRNIGDERAADAIRTCRMQGAAACAILIPEEEANAIIARESGAESQAAGAGRTCKPAATASQTAIHATRQKRWLPERRTPPTDSLGLPALRA